MTDESTLRRPRILVWDLPTRAFHWLLTASVLGAFAIPPSEGRVLAAIAGNLGGA